MNGAEAGSAAGACGYRNLTRMALRSGGLLERAEVALQAHLAADPDNVAALVRLGDVQRGRGRLDAALETYRRAVSLRPQALKPRWLVSILAGQDLAATPTPGAVPFVRLSDFLPPTEAAKLLAIPLANRERFAPSIPTIRTPSGKVDAAVRKGLVLPMRVTDREVRPWFEPPLRRALAAALRKLGRRQPRDCRIEMEMAAYLRGGFLARHDDNRYRKNRALSFAYYFHRLPRPFAGGALLLHDADGNAFTGIEPQHNSIVFFPPSSVHEIAAVEGGPDDFGAARFTLQGWLSSAPAAR